MWAGSDFVGKWKCNMSKEVSLLLCFCAATFLRWPCASLATLHDWLTDLFASSSARRLAFLLWSKQEPTTSGCSSYQHNLHRDRRPRTLAVALLQQYQCSTLSEPSCPATVSFL